jgi:hypothetical protein
MPGFSMRGALRPCRPVLRLLMRNFARVVGFSALAIGLFLILMIGLAVIG